MFRYNSSGRQQYHKPDIDLDISTFFQKTLSLNGTGILRNFYYFIDKYTS